MKTTLVLRDVAILLDGIEIPDGTASRLAPFVREDPRLAEEIAELEQMAHDAGIDMQHRERFTTAYDDGQDFSKLLTASTWERPNDVLDPEVGFDVNVLLRIANARVARSSDPPTALLIEVQQKLERAAAEQQAAERLVDGFLEGLLRLPATLWLVRRAGLGAILETYMPREQALATIDDRLFTHHRWEQEIVVQFSHKPREVCGCWAHGVPLEDVRSRYRRSVSASKPSACADQLADFMEFLNGNLARESGRPLEWHGSFWADRFHLIPISPEPEALVERLRYVLSNTVKENLVARVSDWKGLHCAEALIDGKPMSGMWYDRAIEYETNRQAERKAARNRSAVERVERGAFMTPYDLKLAPLPCWKDLPPAKIRKKIARMIAEIEADAAKLREDLGTEVVGMEKIHKQNSLDRPTRSNRSPKPPCHAASKTMRERFRAAYRAFVAMFQEASLKLKFGRVTQAIFPKGSFPPSLPFIRIGEEFDPLADAGGSRNFALLAAAAI